MIQESVEAAIRDERERVQNEANHAEGPNVAPGARECTFVDFMKCSPITFRGNEGAVGLIRWIEKTKMVFTLSKCTEANKVVFTAATFQDRALTWWNSQVATLGIEVLTRKTGKEMKNNQRQGNARAMTNVRNQNTNEAGKNVKCNRCGMQHYGNCSIKCNKCGKIGHKARDCWSKVVATGENAQPVVTCYGFGEKGHIKTNCPARNNSGRNGARGQAYALRDGDQNLGPNVVTGTMDWLILHDAIIVCGKKELHVPFKKRTLVVKGDDGVSRLKVVSCIKVKKYVDRGSYLCLWKGS
nr:hypothetical protein [Tanacetum cinerariifolium]